MKIYVASSWKNEYQQFVVKALRANGHEVYDFKNPTEGNAGFSWTQIEPSPWTIPQFIDNLEHPIAEDGFKLDFDAMQWSDCTVMVGGCGSSAHLELGWAAGAGKRTVVYLPEMRDRELMIKVADLITPSFDAVLDFLGS